MAATMDPAMAAYLAAAQQVAATQDLTQDQRGSTRNLSIAFTALAVVFVVFRFMARFKQGVKIMWDDWLMIVSLLLLGGNLACNIVMINNGLGLHSGALTLEESMNIGKILLVNEPLYVTNINIIKISLLLLYYRIFPIRSVKLGCWILGGISTAWNLALIGLAEGQCIPIRKAWAPWTSGHCINLKATFLAISVPSILTDIAILALPLPHVWRLQTNLAQRISLMFIFLLGSFVVFTSIYRFTVYINYDPNDLPYTLALGCAWNIVELSSGIISACLPTVGPLVRIVFTQLGTSLNRSRATSNVDKRSRSTGSGLVTIGGGNHSRKQRSQDWSKLDDGSTVVVSTTAASDRGSGDEIPLRAIRQQRDVEWTVEQKN